ncbi:hypothetical protein JTT07_19635 [Clostridium botulinum]|nr:hypothetical protein [Clostridium botulinum]MCS4526999.1 hypothetical protein [Clostridium botulinum]
MVICLLGGIGIYKYIDTSHKKDLSISDVELKLTQNGGLIIAVVISMMLDLNHLMEKV